MKNKKTSKKQRKESAPKKQIKHLFNGCVRTEISVIPENWESANACLDEPWLVWYRYRDPQEKKKYPHGKMVLVRGMNHLHDLKKRQEATKRIINEQMQLLDVYNYNPITDRINVKNTVPEAVDADPQTPFIEALWVGYHRLKFVERTLRDIRSVIRGTEKAAVALDYHNLPISLISRRHIVKIFDKCAELNKRWSNNRQNMYRSYLMNCFKQLVKIEATENNPLLSIDIEPTPEPEEFEPLTDKERKAINNHLHEKCYTYWRYVHIFFNGGARTTELMAVRESHVDLENQRFKTYVRKRKVATWVWRPIKDIVLRLWLELLNEAKAFRDRANEHGLDLYLFSANLQPGMETINTDVIGRRWTKWVKGPKTKGGLDIKKNFNKIRHLHSTELMDELTGLKEIEKAEEAVAKINGHTSTQMLRKVYDLKSNKRKADLIKKSKNRFA